MLNLPTTIVSDLAIHDNDLIAGHTVAASGCSMTLPCCATSGASAAGTRLFKPSDAVRVRRNVNYNTPFPKEVPQAQNPPQGAVIA